MIEDEDVVDDVCTIILFYIVRLFCIIIVFIYLLQIISPQSPILLDDVELMTKGDIENDDYITTRWRLLKTTII